MSHLNPAPGLTFVNHFLTPYGHLNFSKHNGGSLHGHVDFTWVFSTELTVVNLILFFNTLWSVSKHSYDLGNYSVNLFYQLSWSFCCCQTLSVWESLSQWVSGWVSECVSEYVCQCVIEWLGVFVKIFCSPPASYCWGKNTVAPRFQCPPAKVRSLFYPFWDLSNMGKF